MCRWRQRRVRCRKSGWRDFCRSNQDALLALALTASKFGTLPSSLFGIVDDAVALDFDNAAAMRLQQWEDERLAMLHGVKE